MKRRITDPFALLEKEHKSVAALFKRIEKTSDKAGDTRRALFAKLDDALALHAEVEERGLYPTLEEVARVHDITLEAYEEHHVVKILLAELAEMPADNERWLAKLKVLRENVEHHVEEEEDDMFVKARKAMTAEQKQLVVDAMAATRRSFKAGKEPSRKEENKTETLSLQ